MDLIWLFGLQRLLDSFKSQTAGTWANAFFQVYSSQYLGNGICFVSHSKFACNLWLIACASFAVSHASEFIQTLKNASQLSPKKTLKIGLLDSAALAYPKSFSVAGVTAYWYDTTHYLLLSALVLMVLVIVFVFCRRSSTSCRVVPCDPLSANHPAEWRALEAEVKTGGVTLDMRATLIKDVRTGFLEQLQQIMAPYNVYV